MMEEKSQRSFATGILDAASQASMVGQGQGDGLDTSQGDEVVDDVSDLGPAAVVLSVEDDEQGTRLVYRRLVEVYCPLTARE
jgi:hypothetical protein